jgi:4-hydroxy-tetrahydrodipicolinate synthase
MRDGWRGIFTIAATPFDERGALLYDELARHVDWIVRAGSHGVVWPVNHSEVSWLTREERFRGMAVVAEAVGGRVPYVAGVSGAWAGEAAAYTGEAAAIGADAVIGILPQGFPAAHYSLVRDYYAAVSSASDLPVFVQNQGAPWPGLSAETVLRLAREVERVEYVKEEKPPQGRSAQELIDLGGEVLRGVFTGAGCTWLMMEMARGVSGCMPGSPMPDICAKIWNLWHAGDMAGARDLQTRMTAYQTIWRGMPEGARKMVLVKRGILSTPFMRHGAASVRLDAVEDAELDDAIALLAADFTV